MAWLNLNQSLNSLKGQITTFASEVLSDSNVEDSAEGSLPKDLSTKELEEKCRNQDLEIEALKRQNEELQASLNSERFSKKNGLQDYETNWYAWDPPDKTEKVQDVQKGFQHVMLPKPGAGEQYDNLSEVERLREENRNLQANLEDLDNQHQLAMEKLLLLKTELQRNFELLKLDHEELKNTNEEYSSEIKELLLKIGERDKEIESLKIVKSDFETLYHKYQNLERIYGLLRENAEKFQEENQALHEEVFKLQEQVTKMEHDLEVSVQQPKDLSSMVPKFLYDETVKELQVIKSRKKSDPLYEYEVNLDDNSKSLIENLKREIGDLKHKLATNETEVEKSTDNKNVTEKIKQLYDKYVNFEIQVDDVGAIPTGDDVVMFKLETVFKTVNIFKKEIDALQHKLSEKDLNVLHFQTQLDDMTAENEFLTSDIQQLEKELNDTKKNNDFLINEIAALKNTSTLEPIIETHEDNIVKLEAELADSHTLNSNFKEKISQIEKELAQVRTEKNSLHINLSELKLQYEELQRGLEECKNKTDAMEELEIKAKTEKLRKNSTAEDNESLKSQISVLAAKNEQITIDLHIAENDKVLLTTKIDDLKQQLENKTAAINELQSQFTKSGNLQPLPDTIKHTGKRSPPPEEIEMLMDDSSVKCEIVQNTELEGINARLKEIIDEVNNDLATMTHQKDELFNKVVILKKENENSHQIIEELQAKCRHCVSYIKEAKMLKQTNNLLSTKYLALENSLALAEKNITEFKNQLKNTENFIVAVKEKDELIKKLNGTVESCTVTNKRLEEDLAVKYTQIDELKRSIEVVTTKFNEMKKNFTEQKEQYENQITEQRMQYQQQIDEQVDQFEKKGEESQKQINELHVEKNALKAELQSLYEDVKRSQDAIDQLESELQLTQEKNAKCKLMVDSKATRDSENQTDNQYLKDCAKISQDTSFMEKQIHELNNTLVLKEKELTDLRAKYHAQEGCTQCKTTLERTSKEKTELIELLNLKHNESIQYHNEIQRLNNVLVLQTNEFTKMLEEKENSHKISNSDSTECCDKLTQTIVIKDEIIDSLNASLKDYEKLKEELSKTSLTIIGMKEHIAGLEKELKIQTDSVKNLTAENIKLSELEKSHKSELDRLRLHLVEKEDCQTSELLATEQKLNETLARLKQAEDKFKDSNVVYISNSVRANQEIETLRNQIRLIEKQRDELQAQALTAEDNRNKTEASLTNLQVVLEQFQIEKEKDIKVATEKLQNKFEKMKLENDRLQDELTIINAKYEDTLTGLQAANRLSAQLDDKQKQIAEMKQMIRTLQTQLEAAQKRHYLAISNQQDKVDKELVKNLIINFVTAGNNSANNTQVLRILSTVLDFNQKECERLGLLKMPPTDSLAAEFVKFLQAESTPRPALPSIMGIRETPSRRNSTMGPNPLPTPSQVDSNSNPTHTRNLSTGSNNLLFQNLEETNPTTDTVVTLGQLDTGVNQTRNNEGAILKQVLKDN